MTILLLVLLSTIQAKGKLFNSVLREDFDKCLHKNVKWIEEVNNEVKRTKTGKEYIVGMKGKALYKLFPVTDLQEMETEFPDSNLVHCSNYGIAGIRIEDFLVSLEEAQEYFEDVNQDTSFKAEFLSTQIDLACQMRDLSKRLKNLQNSNLLHNDIKLDNIGYDSNGKLVFVDYTKAGSVFDNDHKHHPFYHISIDPNWKIKEYDYEILKFNEVHELAEIFHVLTFRHQFDKLNNAFNPIEVADTPVQCFLNYFRQTNTDIRILFRNDILCLEDYILLKKSTPDNLSFDKSLSENELLREYIEVLTNACSETHEKLKDLIERIQAYHHKMIFPPSRKAFLTQNVLKDVYNDNYHNINKQVAQLRHREFGTDEQQSYHINKSQHNYDAGTMNYNRTQINSSKIQYTKNE